MDEGSTLVPVSLEGADSAVIERLSSHVVSGSASRFAFLVRENGTVDEVIPTARR